MSNPSANFPPTLNKPQNLQNLSQQVQGSTIPVQSTLPGQFGTSTLQGVPQQVLRTVEQDQFNNQKIQNLVQSGEQPFLFTNPSSLQTIGQQSQQPFLMEEKIQATTVMSHEQELTGFGKTVHKMIDKISGLPTESSTPITNLSGNPTTLMGSNTKSGNVADSIQGKNLGSNNKLY